MSIPAKEMSKPVTTLVMLEPPKLSEPPMFLQRYVDFELDDNCSFLSDDQPCVVEEFQIVFIV